MDRNSTNHKLHTVNMNETYIVFFKCDPSTQNQSLLSMIHHLKAKHILYNDAKIIILSQYLLKLRINNYLHVWNQFVTKKASKVRFLDS